MATDRVLRVGVLLVLVLRAAAMQSDLPGRVCVGDKDIRNTPKRLQELSGCRVVEGFLRIVLMENAVPEDFDSMSFPELREVSSYMLVWKVFGLQNLGQLFPNLTIIRGNELMAEHYALIVHDVPNLRELGLSSLQSIYNGAARITENPELCFSETIDWNMLSPAENHNVSFNQDPRLCPKCICEEGRGCWGPRRRCQEPPRPLLARGSNKTRCHERCALGCWGSRTQDCFACKQLEFNGNCVPRCPNGTVSLLGRRCISEDECENMRSRGPEGGIVFRGACVQDCPPGYRLLDKHRPVPGKMRRFKCQACTGPCGPCLGAAIRTVADARNFRGCTVVQGTLEIIISHGVDVEKELERSLGSIQEIWGSLIVSRSRPLSTLRFLRSLRLIKGQFADRGLSLFVNDNDNLQYLFDWGENGKASSLIVTSPNNKTNVTFYYNPRLCPQEIQKFKEVTNITTIIDQYNGFINPCGASNGSTRVALRGPGFVQLSWEPWRSSEVIGYAVYLTEAKKQNVIEYAETNLCDIGTARWAVHDVQFEKGAKEVTQFVPHLRPATLYAYYIKTYTAGANVFSDIQYFRTTSTRPTLPINVMVSALEGGDLLVSWEPPLRPNGVLSHYIVIGELREDEERQLAARDYCLEPLGPARRLVAPPPPQSCCCSGCCHVPLDEDQCERIIRGDRGRDRDRSRPVLDACGLPVASMDRCTHLFYTLVAENLMTASSHFPTKQSEDQRPEIDLAEKWIGERNGSDWVRRFVRTLDADTRSTRLSRLRPFGLYFIYVHACGHVEGEEQNPSPLDALCSAPALSSARTLPLLDADTLQYAQASSAAGSILVNWREPVRPNGLIVSYQIRYRDLPQRQEQRELCVSRQSHRRDGGARIPVQPGVYEVRVRATSLGGPGPWSPAGTVEVAEQGHRTHAVVVVVTLFLVLALLSAGLLLLRWHQKRQERDRDRGSDTRRLVNDSDPSDWWDLPPDESWPPPPRAAHPEDVGHPVAAFRRDREGEGDVICTRLAPPDQNPAAERRREAADTPWESSEVSMSGGPPDHNPFRSPLVSGVSPDESSIHSEGSTNPFVLEQRERSTSNVEYTNPYGFLSHLRLTYDDEVVSSEHERLNPFISDDPAAVSNTEASEGLQEQLTDVTHSQSESGARDREDANDGNSSKSEKSNKLSESDDSLDE